MSFHPPIDQVQWRTAQRSYEAMRTNLRLLRRAYPPQTDEQVAILHTYRAAAQLFARELLRPRGKIRAEQLNELELKATTAYVEYLEKYMLDE